MSSPSQNALSTRHWLLNLQKNFPDPSSLALTTTQGEGEKQTRNKVHLLHTPQTGIYDRHTHNVMVHEYILHTPTYTN